jgi:hypothetical protein
MKGLLMNILQALGLVDDYATRDEIINAQIEDEARNHEKLIGQLRGAIDRRVVTNDELRHAIRIAKHRTSSFADFERMSIRREELK